MSATQIGSVEGIGLAPARADDSRPRASGPAVANLPTQATRQIDDGALNEVVDRALVAVACACDVDVASAIDGRLDYRQPERRDSYFKSLTDASILAAARVLHPEACREADVSRAEEIANRVCATRREAEAFLALACERAASIATQPRFWDCHTMVRRKLVDGGGWWDLKFRAPRETTPLIQIEPMFDITMPAPIVNVTSAPADAPTVNVNVPLQAEKVVSFSRNYDGEIIEATTSSVGAA